MAVQSIDLPRDTTMKDIAASLRVIAGFTAADLVTMKQVKAIVEGKKEKEVFTIGDQITVPWTDKATNVTYAAVMDDTPEDSIKDYYNLITRSARYAAAVNVTDARTAITAIKEGGYATSPTYVTNVMAVIDSNNLTQYDNVVTGNTEPQPAESKSAEELADEIINGVWGNNPERRENITAKYGAEAYEAAQAIVNQRAGATEPAQLSKSTEELAQEIINGVWGSNPERRENITAQYGAAAYEAAQARVNEIMGAGSTIKSKTAEELADEIIRGEWGSNPERRENITAQYGADAYRAAQAIVNERMG